MKSGYTNCKELKEWNNPLTHQFNYVCKRGWFNVIDLPISALRRWIKFKSYKLFDILVGLHGDNRMDHDDGYDLLYILISTGNPQKVKDTVVSDAQYCTACMRNIKLYKSKDRLYFWFKQWFIEEDMMDIFVNRSVEWIHEILVQTLSEKNKYALIKIACQHMELPYDIIRVISITMIDVHFNSVKFEEV